MMTLTKGTYRRLVGVSAQLRRYFALVFCTGGTEKWKPQVKCGAFCGCRQGEKRVAALTWPSVTLFGRENAVAVAENSGAYRCIAHVIYSGWYVNHC